VIASAATAASYALSSWRRELRWAIRGAARHRQRSALVVAVLALSLATNLVMFGVIDQLFFAKPPLVRDPDRIIRVTQVIEQPARGRVTRERLSYPTYEKVSDRLPSLEAIAGAFRSTVSVGEGQQAYRAQATYVTSSYFTLLGVAPRIGRAFSVEEDATPQGQPVVLLSDALWMRQFAGDRNVIGRNLRLDGTAYRVIGVMPAGFNGTDMQVVDVWLPLSVAGSRLAGSTWDFNSNVFWIETLGRLRSGSSVTSAGEARGVVPAGRGMAALVVSPLSRARGADRPMEALVALWLGGVAFVVLLVACANVGTLYLVRGIERRSEFAMRLALGATQGQLRIAVLSEAVVLSVMGLVAGAIVAFAATKVLEGRLQGLIPGPVMTADRGLAISMITLVMAVTLVTAILPLAQLRERSLESTLRGASHVTPRENRTGRFALLALQVALTTTLLTGAALFFQSFHAVSDIDLGFEPDRVIVADLDPQGRLEPPALEQQYAEVQQDLRAEPGVERSALGISAPFMSGVAVRVEIPGRDSLPPETGGAIYVNAVTSDFFATLGMRVLQGRFFTERDASGAHVAVINRHFAESIWPGERAIGRCLHIYTRTAPCFVVVGIVADPKRDRLGEDPVSQFFVPLETAPALARTRLLFARIRSTQAKGVAAVVRSIQRALPNAPYPNVRSLSAVTGLQRRPWALGALLFGIFATLALLISCLGLYNLIFHDVKSRERELAIRLTLGATARDVIGSVVLGTGAAALVGLAAGIVGGLWMGTLIEPLLFRTRGVQLEVSLGVAAFICTTAATAAFQPTRRALGTEPARVLREG
jgi:putative ABC transport system permease protein